MDHTHQMATTGSQTWLAGKSPMMDSWNAKIFYKWRFSIAMFDYRSVQQGKWQAGCGQGLLSNSVSFIVVVIIEIPMILVANNIYSIVHSRYITILLKFYPHCVAHVSPIITKIIIRNQSYSGA